MNSSRQLQLAARAAFLFVFMAAPAAAKWKYFRAGSQTDSTVKPQAGYALMGGGARQEAAYKYLCEHANGGDFLILRANTDDDYAKKVNDETLAVCHLNSAATIVLDDREDSSDPQLLKTIDEAEAIYFAGGDQSNYIRFLQDTPAQDAINRHIAEGKPIGGSSAGLAILGQFSFAAILDTVDSAQALANPYNNEVTLARDFLTVPLLDGVITDTHFRKRDRMGRLLTFLARILQDGWARQARAIAVEENAAVLLEPSGEARVVGYGPAYFIEADTPPGICKYKTPLTFRNIAVHRANAGAMFNVREWKGEGGDDYTLSVVAGKVTANGSTHGIY